jgi:hypothetical protein
MGFYEKQVLARILNATCGVKTIEPLRGRVCAGLAGDIVEIGFGSGLNVPFYPGHRERHGSRLPRHRGGSPGH